MKNLDCMRARLDALSQDDDAGTVREAFAIVTARAIPPGASVAAMRTARTAIDSGFQPGGTLAEFRAAVEADARFGDGGAVLHAEFAALHSLLNVAIPPHRYD